MLLITLGLPGAGKGAIARKLKSFLNFEILATGEILRNAITENSPLGTKVKEIVLAGDLIDDETALQIVSEHLDPHKDTVLDGFPRTQAQVALLEDLLEARGMRIEAVLYFDVDEANMQQRLEGRRVCPDCHAVYHMTNFPPKDGINCDRCGHKVEKRFDDTPENIAHRITHFNEVTLPLVDYYEHQGLLKTIDANQSTMDMYYQVLETSQHFTNRDY